MDLRPIGIFDSGVGGLTAAAELMRQAPEESVVYFGDTLRAPYGDRTPEDIRRLSRRNARFLRSRGVKAILVACNTSTANALAELTADNPDVPLVGTVGPASEAAVRASESGRIGVLATGAVVKSGLYARTIEALRPDAQVTSAPCPKLVPLIESGHTDPADPALRAALREYLAPILAAGADTIVLGCTHYPLVREAVLAELGRDLPLIDSGGACVGALLETLRARDGLAAPGAVRTEEYYCSARPEGFAAVAEGFLGRSIADRTREIDVDGY